MARGLWSSVAGLAVAVAALAVVAPRCAAQTTAGCTLSIVSLSPCLSFTAGNTSAPSALCCSALESVVHGAPRCLCAVLGGGASSLGVTVNTTRALELPGKCKIQTPPASQCNAAGAPVASPATPGAGSTSPSAPAATVEAPTAPPPAASSATGAGSKATPATGAVSSGVGAGVTKSTAVAVSFVVSVASLMAF